MRRKSSGVPATGTIFPVGIRVASVGVYRLALIRSRWLSIEPDAWPARLKYEWLVMLMTVGLSVVAWYRSRRALPRVSVKVTLATTVPGKPSCMSGLV